MVIWKDIINNLEFMQGEAVTVDPARWDMSNPEYLKIYCQWEQCNFNMDSIRWINYYPGKHFDQAIVEHIAKDLNIKVHRAWISRIDPGYMAPWHWDVDDQLSQYESVGEVIRFSIFIGDAHPAHFFSTESRSFSNTSSGTVYKWTNYKSWHAGSNAGLIPKYMFHIIGYQS